MSKNHHKHLPVLMSEVLRLLKPQAGQSYLDLTAGYGGHASAILRSTKQPGSAVLVDRDQQAAEALRKLFGADVKILHQDFLSASRQMMEQGRSFDMILADLGVSSPHLEEASRGFSIQKSGPLDMRLDQTQKLSAADILNNWSEKQLVEMLQSLGEEPKARLIAREIVKRRPLVTTDQLAAIARRAWPRRSRVHPATRTFQALRIAVNSELQQLEESLPLWVELLAPGGRLAVISFHSLEDRIVKRFFAEATLSPYESQLNLLTKKPVTAGRDEIVLNPRARSAKLRAVAKIKNRKD